MSFSRQNWRLIGALLVVTALGFSTKFYRGPGESWLNDSLAGMFYVVFWCLAAALCLRRASPLRIAIVVLAVTCGLEVLQLWHPPWLKNLRATFLGAALLGTTFVASDFLYYGIGAVLGGWGVHRLRPSLRTTG